MARDPIAGEAALALAPLADVAAALARRELAAREVTEACLAQAERHGERLGIFVTPLRERALARADELDRADRPVGPLHGVPYGVKDFFEVEGVPLTCGNGARRDVVATRTAPAVRALEDAGGILLGTLNLHEWAFGATSDNPHFGPVRNPWDPGRAPGGSSGGSAAAVAAGIGFFALGTDTGGSIRLPASWCGVAGLKVTSGAISGEGCYPLSWTLDTVGPLARTVADLELPFGLMAATGSVEERPGPRELAGARVGVLAGDLDPGRLDPGVHRAVTAALESLEQAGCSIRELEVPALDAVPEAQAAIVFPEAATVHAGTREGYGGDVRTLLALGDAVPARDYIAAQRFRDVVGEDLRRAFEEVDVIVSPTTPDRAEPIGTGEVRFPDGSVAPLLDAVIRFLLRWSFSGLPALSLACGVEDGLPVGLQLAGPPGAERTLLALGREAQEAFGRFRPEGVE